MKKYQLWLERKKYSQHLNNLIRIKLQPNLPKCHSTRKIGINRHSLDFPDTQLAKESSPFFLSTRDLSYTITPQQLQKHKLRLIRSNEIVRENQEMVKRLNKIKPFVSNTRPTDQSHYKIKRKMQRNSEEQSYELLDRNYREFAKAYNQNSKIGHRYQLLITLQELNQKISSHPSTELCIEVLTPHAATKSELVEPSSIIKHPFRLTFADELPQSITLRLHQYKGLEHSVRSQYVLKIPELGGTHRAERNSNCQLGSIVANLTYTKLKPKFWNINHFRV